MHRRVVYFQFSFFIRLFGRIRPARCEPKGERMNSSAYLLSKGEPNPFRAAILLAMTETIEEEKDLIAFFRQHNCYCVATMLSGNDKDTLRKITGNIVGAGLNAGIIERKHAHIHPLGHAIEEAVDGTRLDSSVGQNCRFKIGIARKGNAIAVAIYGDLGFHECSSHKTIGGGFQILGE